MAVLLSLSAKEKLHALHINILTTSFFLSSYKMLLFSFLFCLFGAWSFRPSRNCHATRVGNLGNYERKKKKKDVEGEEGS